MRKDGWETVHEEFPGLYDGAFGPTTEVLGFAESPLELFLFFLPRKFWLKLKKIESNQYYKQKLPGRIEAKFRAQTGDNQLTLEQIFANEKRLHKKIETHEILRCIGLLLARMLCPHTRRLSDHWATSSGGAKPVGSFGRFLKRDRFDRIMRYLHFSNNTAPEAATTRRGRSGRSWRHCSGHSGAATGLRQFYLLMRQWCHHGVASTPCVNS
ncbi:unnamed protein product [Phytophthora fragariaefolia]|uniref:Unnamed protein product n=1 Tax=Phytophthora fragariaefolia TaxID=1490495 RepID=A0A9W6XUP5_9STRA|nr:unnamed protein product [Phytophthora fragariaefolia]